MIFVFLSPKWKTWLPLSLTYLFTHLNDFHYATNPPLLLLLLPLLLLPIFLAVLSHSDFLDCCCHPLLWHTALGRYHDAHLHDSPPHSTWAVLPWIWLISCMMPSSFHLGTQYVTAGYYCYCPHPPTWSASSSYSCSNRPHWACHPCKRRFLTPLRLWLNITGHPSAHKPSSRLRF